MKRDYEMKGINQFASIINSILTAKPYTQDFLKDKAKQKITNEQIQNHQTLMIVLLPFILKSERGYKMNHHHFISTFLCVGLSSEY